MRMRPRPHRLFLLGALLGSLSCWSLAEPASGQASPPKSIATRTKGVDWPIFLGPTGDSKSPERGILKDWKNKPPRSVWAKELGEGYGIGTVAYGRFFQFDRFGDKARIYCLNAETGVELWRHEYPTQYTDLYNYSGGPRCSPIIDGNRLYALGVEGMLHCLSVETGKTIWKVDTSEEFNVIQNFFGVGSNPVVVGDVLIVMVGGSPAEDKSIPPGRLDLVSGNGSGLVGFDKLTGKVLYKITDELASYSSLKHARIGARDWCFAFARGGLVGFEPKTGKVDFEFPWRAKSLESVNASSPVVVGDEVLISETYGPGAAVLRASPGKAETVWADSPREREKKLQTHWNTPIHHEGYVYASSGRHTGNAELRCIRWKDGKVMWSEPGLSRTSLLYADGHLICLGEYGVLRLLRCTPEKFDQVAALRIGDGAGGSLLKYPCWAAPVLSHGLLYIRGEGRLVCIDLIPD